MKHYIIVKYVDEITAEQKQQLLPGIKDLFDHLLEIEGISEVNVCPNVINRSNRYDLMIEIEMKDEETLCVYDASIWHHKWKDDYGHLVAKKTIFDR